MVEGQFLGIRTEVFDGLSFRWMATPSAETGKQTQPMLRRLEVTQAGDPLWLSGQNNRRAIGHDRLAMENALHP